MAATAEARSAMLAVRVKETISVYVVRCRIMITFYENKYVRVCIQTSAS